MKVATKLSAAFGGLAVILAGLLIYHVRTIHHVVSANFELSEISSRLYFTTTRQIAALNQLEENASKYWVTRDRGYLTLFDDAFGDFEAALRDLEAHSLTAEERAEVERLEALWREFRPVAAELETSVLPEPSTVALRAQLASLRFQVRRASDAAQAALYTRLEASATAGRRAERLSWIAAAGTLLLSMLVFWLTVRSISRALARLQHGTREVADGNFEYRIPADRNDEFAQLARAFNVMTQRLGELDRMKRDFLSKVSHDLKTPLASMQETVQVMLDGVPGPVTAKQRRLLELTSQSAQRLSGMISKILDLSAMEAGTLALDTRMCDLRDVLQPAVDAIAPTDAGAGQRIHLELPQEPVFAECDGDRMIQVVVNLLENAIKYSPAGTPITVGVRFVAPDDADLLAEHLGRIQPDGRWTGGALIEVTDRGFGVPDADKSRIFEHFFQSNNGNRTSGRGVGLGLAICREITDLHGGAVWVRDHAGGGSVFAVLLPRAVQGTAWIAPRVTAASPQPLVTG